MGKRQVDSSVEQDLSLFENLSDYVQLEVTNDSNWAAHLYIEGSAAEPKGLTNIEELTRMFQQVKDGIHALSKKLQSNLEEKQNVEKINLELSTETGLLENMLKDFLSRNKEQFAIEKSEFGSVEGVILKLQIDRKNVGGFENAALTILNEKEELLTRLLDKRRTRAA